jgi:ribosomal 30S subunit maturation factor RimM
MLDLQQTQFQQQRDADQQHQLHHQQSNEVILRLLDVQQFEIRQQRDGAEIGTLKKEVDELRQQLQYHQDLYHYQMLEGKHLTPQDQPEKKEEGGV